ncbi:DNA topoisomerase 2-like protein [Tanacetum coccineum]
MAFKQLCWYGKCNCCVMCVTFCEEFVCELEDANLAATANSGNCTLILTQGNSAKALAMSGLSVVGNDCYGVYPLTGKLLNVKEARVYHDGNG